MNELKIGQKNELSVLVDDTNTAISYKSGTVPVFSTPHAMALCEQTCALLAEDALDENHSTVGIYVELFHTAPTVKGKTVTCTAELIEIEKNKLTFSCVLVDHAGVVCKATHKRAIINKEKFLLMAESR